MADHETDESADQSAEDIKGLGLTRQAVCDRLRVPMSQVRKLIRTGQLTPFRRVNKEDRFKVEDVDALRDELEELATKPGDPNPVLMQALKDSGEHLRSFAELVIKPSKDLYESQAKRIRELEAKNAELIKAAEDNIFNSRQAAKEEKEADRRHAMQVKALGALTDFGMPLLMKKLGLAGAMPTGKPAPPQEGSPVDNLSTDQKLLLFGHLANLLQQLSPEQVEGLKEIWPEGHYQAVKGVYAMLTGRA